MWCGTGTGRRVATCLQGIERTSVTQCAYPHVMLVHIYLGLMASTSTVLRSIVSIGVFLHVDLRDEVRSRYLAQGEGVVQSFRKGQVHPRSWLASPHNARLISHHAASNASAACRPYSHFETGLFRVTKISLAVSESDDCAPLQHVLQCTHIASNCHLAYFEDAST
jgi:hypothetical protein